MSINLMKENGFTLKKTKNGQYSAETITDADYLVLLAKSLLHSLEQTLISM